MTNQMTITNELMAYAEALMRYGMFVVDSKGKGDFSPMVKDAMYGMHQILAGGDVSLRVASPGKPQIYNELNSKLEAALHSVNPVKAMDGETLFTP